MSVAYGYVSTGVSALLASASMALAGARFLYETVAGAEPEDRADLLKKAASLSDSARQNELAAWELCAKEAVIRRRNADSAVALPWLSGPDTILSSKASSPDGTVKRGPGRPRKVSLLTEGQPHA